MDQFNIYIIGVGGQGIGMLSEIILRACDYAEHIVKSVDTHGLAQRGGTVISQIRLGEKVYSPLIPKENSDLAIALERHEALRALEMALKKNGKGHLVYYDTVWQPLSVRLGEAKEVSPSSIFKKSKRMNINLTRVLHERIQNTRMQNTIILSEVCHQKIIPYVTLNHYERAMSDLMESSMLEENLNLFRSRLDSKSIQ